MKIVKIKNKYMFNSAKPEQEHTYLHYYDRKAKETRLIQTTHLYEIPPKKRQNLRYGVLKEFKFKDSYLPSGVNNHYLNTDINGKKLPYRSNMYKYVGTVSQKQAKKVLSFGGRRKRK